MTALQWTMNTKVLKHSLHGVKSQKECEDSQKCQNSMLSDGILKGNVPWKLLSYASELLRKLNMPIEICQICARKNKISLLLQTTESSFWELFLKILEMSRWKKQCKSNLILSGIKGCKKNVVNKLKTSIIRTSEQYVILTYFRLLIHLRKYRVD